MFILKFYIICKVPCNVVRQQWGYKLIIQTLLLQELQ